MTLTEERFNRAFSAFMIAGMVLALVGISVFKIDELFRQQHESGDVQVDTTAITLIVVSAFSSLMGVLATVMSANGHISTFLFGFVDVAIYGVLCFISARYGNALLHFLYFVPMQFIGYFQWKKRGADWGSFQKHKNAEKPRARRLDGRRWALCALFCVSCGTISYLVLSRFDATSESAWKIAVFLDVVPLVCNIVGQFLMSKAYAEQWIFWMLVNIFSIAMWTQTLTTSANGAFASIYIVKYSFYLINSVNGLRIWIKLSKS